MSRFSACACASASLPLRDRLLQLVHRRRDARAERRVDDARDLPHHQHVRIVEAHRRPGPSPARAASSACRSSGGGRRGSRTARVRGRGRRGRAWGRSSTSIISDTASAWPIAHTCTPSHSRLRFSQSASGLKCAGSTAVNVSSSNAIRGWPGAHQPMRDEAVAVAEVAGQAQLARAAPARRSDRAPPSGCPRASRCPARAIRASARTGRGTPRRPRRRRARSARRGAPSGTLCVWQSRQSLVSEACPAPDSSRSAATVR